VLVFGNSAGFDNGQRERKLELYDCDRCQAPSLLRQVVRRSQNIMRADTEVRGVVWCHNTTSAPATMRVQTT
jgi:hypothetical protein